MVYSSSLSLMSVKKVVSECVPHEVHVESIHQCHNQARQVVPELDRSNCVTFAAYSHSQLVLHIGGITRATVPPNAKGAIYFHYSSSTAITRYKAIG